MGIGETFASAGAATFGRGSSWRMTSSVGTSASTVMVIARLPFCSAVTTAVAVDRPSWNTSMSSSTGAPTITARLKTAVADRTDLSGNRLATATIACASTWVPSTTCRSSAPASPVSALIFSEPSNGTSKRSSRSCSVQSALCDSVVMTVVPLQYSEAAVRSADGW